MLDRNLRGWSEEGVTWGIARSSDGSRVSRARRRRVVRLVSLSPSWRRELSRQEWTDEALAAHHSFSRSLRRVGARSPREDRACSMAPPILWTRLSRDSRSHATSPATIRQKGISVLAAWRGTAGAASRSRFLSGTSTLGAPTVLWRWGLGGAAPTSASELFRPAGVPAVGSRCLTPRVRSATGLLDSGGSCHSRAGGHQPAVTGIAGSASEAERP
jgi:hypothetical protein